MAPNQAVMPVIPQIAKGGEQSGAIFSVCVPQILDFLPRSHRLLCRVIAHIDAGRGDGIIFQELWIQRHRLLGVCFRSTGTEGYSFWRMGTFGSNRLCRVT